MPWPPCLDPTDLSPSAPPSASPPDASGEASPSADGYDSPWKEAIEQGFPEFLAFYFPEACAGIDWSRGFEFLDTELRRLLRDADASDRHADKLVKVYRRDGTEDRVYIHIEVQASRKADFERRMFTMAYRLYDHYQRPIASLALLADDDAGWRPDHYEVALFGSRLRLDFPVVKLLDLADDVERLLADPNPFALVTAGHLLTRWTRGDDARRYAAKRRLVLLLYQHGWTRERVQWLFKVLDWMMQVSPLLDRKLWQDIDEIEGRNGMGYISSIERIAMQEGRKKGIEQGLRKLLLRQLAHRFGPLPADVTARLDAAPQADLERWGEQFVEADSLEAVFAASPGGEAGAAVGTAGDTPPRDLR